MSDAAKYLGIKNPDAQTIKDISEAEKTASSLTPTITKAEFCVKTEKDGILLSGTDVILKGTLAKSKFDCCRKIVVVLATLGLQSEILLARTFALSPKKGIVLDAVYTDLLEKLLDETEKELEKEYGCIQKRISCGYGDLPICTQKQLFDLIDGERLGVKMNECFMLVPNKSVIALIGVK